MRPRLLDLSRPLGPGTPVFPGDPEFDSSPAATVERDGFAVAGLRLSTHTGTHVDAPAHVLPGGATLDDLPLDLFCGPALVIDVTAAGAVGIGPDVLPREVTPGTIVLFRTGWDAHAGTPAEFDHPFLLPATARRLRTLGVRTVGIDCASVDAPGHLAVHRELAGPPGDPGVVVENLAHLDRLPRTGCVVQVFPLPLLGGDGSPVRAVARY